MSLVVHFHNLIIPHFYGIVKVFRHEEGIYTVLVDKIGVLWYTDKDPLGIMWDYDYVKQDQIDWYAGKIEAHKATNAAVYATLSDEQRLRVPTFLNPRA